ncbi:MAG: SufE family protein [Rhodothermales bacterium]|nr:SufE family protein [Rhodothermales bacterium]
MPTLPDKLQRTVDELAGLDRMTRYMVLLDYADRHGDFPEAAMTEPNRVRGCTSTVYLTSELEGGRMRYAGFADAQIVKGLVAMLVGGLSGEPPEAVAAVDPRFIRDAGLAEALTPTRAGGLANILRRMQADAEQHLDEQPLD